MKGYKLRIFIYIAAFIITAVASYIFKISNIIYKSESTGLSSAGLPVVSMLSDEGMEYNYLTGYVTDINYLEMHGVITPVSTDRIMNFNVDSYGLKLTGISYEVRSLDGEELIERNSISDINSEKLSIKFKNLLETGKEYMLKIIISSEKYDDAAYYTRIVLMDNAYVDRKLQYVEKFARNTMDSETLNDVIPKLEPDKTGDNTNLGHVNIHCKLSQVGFGGLGITASSDFYPQIDEIYGDVASITLKYKAKSSDDSRNYEYDITEFYRINQVDEDVTYVYAFDRFIDQTFDPEYGITSSGNIYLGISSTDETEIKDNSTGTVTAFVANGNLWSYHPNRDRFNKVFSFEEGDSDGLRESNSNHGIKIIDVDKDGNIKFIVYGYMNRGLHEGQNGIAVYYYSANDNLSKELVFIPATDSCLTLENELDHLCYYNDQNILYFYQNGTIYYLNYETKECMLVDNGILPDTCMTNSDNILVYQNDKDANHCDNITVLWLETGNRNEITCESDEKIKMLGFINNNIVYGIADTSDIKGDSFPMKKIYILDSELKELREYGSEGMYISSVEFYDSKLVINRMTVNEDGEYVDIASDQLISGADELLEESVTKIITSDTREKELYIVPLTTGSETVTSQAAKYELMSDSTVHLNENETTTENMYYVYTYGRLYYISADYEACEQLASDTGGVVTDSNGDTIWTRYKDKK